MSRSLAVLLVVLAVLASSCSTSRKERIVRPQPGDTVMPRLFHAGPWQAGTSVVLMTRLVADGPAGESVLRPEEVPEETKVSAAITFLAGEREVGRLATTFVMPPC
jgi:hypothetical protein